jgi:hypothetical protein
VSRPRRRSTRTARTSPPATRPDNRPRGCGREQESGAYGIEPGTPKQRSDRFECEALTGLLSPQETTTFKRTYYELTEARCGPSPYSHRTRDPAEILPPRDHGQRLTAVTPS